VKLVQFDFPFEGPFGEEMATALRELAQSIAGEPGLVWKIWTENAIENEGGGVHLFEDEASAPEYIEKHTARLAAFGIPAVRAKLFDVNAPLSEVTRAPLAAAARG